jgi:hypothetical protein
VGPRAAAAAHDAARAAAAAAIVVVPRLRRHRGRPARRPRPVCSGWGRGSAVAGKRAGQK